MNQDRKEEEWIRTSFLPNHQHVGLVPVRCQSWGPIKKQEPSLLEKIRPLTSENNKHTCSDSKPISHALLRVRWQWPTVPRWDQFYTLMSTFTDIKRGLLQTSSRPALADLSPVLCFYLRLIQTDRSANIDHGVLWKILPPGLRGDYRPRTQLMQAASVHVCTFRFLLPCQSGHIFSLIFFSWTFPNHMRRHL